MKALRIILVVIIVGFLAGSSHAQMKILKAAKIHQGNGEVLENAYLVIDKGDISYVGERLPDQYSSQSIKDLGDAQIYPAIIALNTQLGLNEIDAVRATRDYREVGKFNPNVRSIIAYNTDSEVTKTVVSNGILMAQICPTGAWISGKSSAVKLRAWNWEDAAISLEDGIHLNWPKKYQKQGWWADLKPDKKLNSYESNLSELTHYFEQCQAYSESAKEESQLKFEAIKEVLDGKLRLYIHINEASSMMDALHFCANWDIEPIFYGAAEAQKIIPMLKEHQAKIVLTRVKRLPSQIDEGIWDSYKLATALKENDLTFAIACNGSWEQRNLVFQASQAVSYGLDYNEAIRSITLSAAEIMGIDRAHGSIEEGKSADFIISKGDLLQLGESVILEAYFNGEFIDLMDKQKQLYEKYMDKYNLSEN